MTPSNVQAKLIELFPEFATYWDSPHNYHRDDDGTLSLWGVFAQFSHFVGERFAFLPPPALDHLGAFIEQCLESPGSDLSNAAATCFLENVVGETFTPALAQHFGSRARAFLSQYGHPA